MNLLEKPPKKDLNVIRNIVNGKEKADILYTAIDLNVFNYLTSPATSHMVSEEAGTDSRLTEKLLNVLTALNLLEKGGNEYVNREVAENFLVKESRFCRGNLLELKKKRLKDWRKIAEAVRGEQSREDKDPKFDKTFIHAHAEGAVSGPLQRAVRAVASLDEFERSEKLLDLGGGHGLYSIAFSQLNSNLNVSLFDLPHVTEIGREYLRKYEKESEVSIIEGDFTEDDIGEGYDIVFASDVSLSEEDVLERIYDSLKENGILIYRRWVMDSNEASPLTSVLFDFKMAVNGNNHPVRTLEGYREILEGSGFSVDTVFDIATPQDPAKIMVGKKGD